jgi:hypothetical protein
MRRCGCAEPFPQLHLSSFAERRSVGVVLLNREVARNFHHQAKRADVPLSDGDTGSGSRARVWQGVGIFQRAKNLFGLNATKSVFVQG